jgi:hypothetical protein
MPKPYSEMNEWDKKDDRIRWAQAANLSVNIISAALTSPHQKEEWGMEKIQRGLTSWREWFYDELCKPTPIEAEAETEAAPKNRPVRLRVAGKMMSVQNDEHDTKGTIDQTNGVGDEPQYGAGTKQDPRNF